MNEAVFIKRRYPDIDLPKDVERVNELQKNIYYTSGKLAEEVGCLEFIPSEEDKLEVQFKIDEGLLNQYCDEIISNAEEIREIYLRFKEKCGA